MKLDNAFGIHEQALKLRTHRAELLAGNIANADTPGYKARDFDFQKLMQQQLPSRESMRVTSPRHIQPESGPVSASEIFYRIPASRVWTAIQSTVSWSIPLMPPMQWSIR